MKQKPSKKPQIFVSILIFLASILILISSRAQNKANINTFPDLFSSITPTPYSLPTQVYDSQSFFTRIIGQIFTKGNQNINPARIVNDGQRVADNAYLDLYVVNDYLPVTVEWWQQKSEPVFEYVRERLDTTFSEKVIVTFVSSKRGNCSPRGTTFHEQPSIIVIFADQDTSKEQILATLAHELGHVFIHQKYENLSDVALTEGMATWAAGDYWKRWKGFDFNTGVKAFIKNGEYQSLSPNYDMRRAYDENSSECIRDRDILLTEFASFLDYLTQNYGVESLARLFDVKQPEVENNKRVVYPPNFKDVYGLELNQLEHKWLKTVYQP